MALKYRRKKKKAVAKRPKKWDENLQKDFIRALCELKQTFLADNNYYKLLWSHLRALYCPVDTERFTANEDYDYPLYDPAAIKAVDRAVSGYQSYHISPNDTYFELDAFSDLLKSIDESDKDTEKALGKRTKDIHSIKQHPHNYAVMTKNIRDKLIFNLTAKVIDEHPVMVAKFEHFDPEDVALASSNGMEHDIFGVRRRLTPFQMNVLFKKKLTDNKQYQSASGDVARRPKRNDLNSFEGDYYYRFNVPVSVLREYVLIGKREHDTDYMELVNHYLPLTKEDDTLWVDVKFTDYDLLSINILPFRKIIVSKMFPENVTLGVGKGIGEKALAVTIELNEVAQTNLTAYERTYGPSYTAFGEADVLNVDLSTDFVNFISEGAKPVTANSLNADMNGIIAYFNHMEAKVMKMFDLDVFELINKSRMPGSEVDIRKSDDYRKLGIYLAQDSNDDLNPTVLVLNYILHNYIKEQKGTDFLQKKVLNARYISAIAMAHKNSSMDQALMIFKLMMMAKQIGEKDDELSDTFSPRDLLEEIFLKVGAKKLIRTEEEEEEMKEQRKQITQLRMDKEQGDALASASNAIRSTGETFEGGNLPSQQSGQTVPAQPAQGI